MDQFFLNSKNQPIYPYPTQVPLQGDSKNSFHLCADTNVICSLDDNATRCQIYLDYFGTKFIDIGLNIALTEYMNHSKFNEEALNEIFKLSKIVQLITMNANLGSTSNNLQMKKRMNFYSKLIHDQNFVLDEFSSAIVTQIGDSHQQEGIYSIANSKDWGERQLFHALSKLSFETFDNLTQEDPSILWFQKYIQQDKFEESVPFFFEEQCDQQQLQLKVVQVWVDVVSQLDIIYKNQQGWHNLDIPWLPPNLKDFHKAFPTLDQALKYIDEKLEFRPIQQRLNVITAAEQKEIICCLVCLYYEQGRITAVIEFGAIQAQIKQLHAFEFVMSNILSYHILDGKKEKIKNLCSVVIKHYIKKVQPTIQSTFKTHEPKIASSGSLATMCYKEQKGIGPILTDVLLSPVDAYTTQILNFASTTIVWKKAEFHFQDEEREQTLTKYVRSFVT